MRSPRSLSILRRHRGLLDRAGAPPPRHIAGRKLSTCCPGPPRPRLVGPGVSTAGTLSTGRWGLKTIEKPGFPRVQSLVTPPELSHPCDVTASITGVAAGRGRPPRRCMLACFAGPGVQPQVRTYTPGPQHLHSVHVCSWDLRDSELLLPTAPPPTRRPTCRHPIYPLRAPCSPLKWHSCSDTDVHARRRHKSWDPDKAHSECRSMCAWPTPPSRAKGWL